MKTVFLLLLPMEPRLAPLGRPTLMGPIGNLVIWYIIWLCCNGSEEAAAAWLRVCSADQWCGTEVETATDMGKGSAANPCHIQ
jgi:hypothetical protein